jgi:hypothetical protein
MESEYTSAGKKKKAYEIIPDVINETDISSRVRPYDFIDTDFAVGRISKADTMEAVTMRAPLYA